MSVLYCMYCNVGTERTDYKVSMFNVQLLVEIVHFTQFPFTAREPRGEADTDF